MSGLIMGVDPGKQGAWAVVDEDGKLVAHGRQPLIGGESGRREESMVAMADVVRQWNPRLLVVEHIQAGPVMSKHASVSLGRSLGRWEGIAVAMRIPLQTVRPKEWQKVIGTERIGAKDIKSAATACAQNLWPSELSEVLRVRRNQGIADAALMAEWGRRWIR